MPFFRASLKQVGHISFFKRRFSDLKEYVPDFAQSGNSPGLPFFGTMCHRPVLFLTRLNSYLSTSFSTLHPSPGDLVPGRGQSPRLMWFYPKYRRNRLNYQRAIATLRPKTTILSAILLNKELCSEWVSHKNFWIIPALPSLSVKKTKYCEQNRQ